MLNQKLNKQYQTISSLDFSKLSELSNIHLAFLIAQTIDLLNDEKCDYCDSETECKKCDRAEKIQIKEMISNLEYLWDSIFSKYYLAGKDFYPSYEKPCISFLTYLYEIPNEYLEYDNIVVKIMVLENFIELFYDYKKNVFLSSVNLDDCKKNLIEWTKFIY